MGLAGLQAQPLYRHRPAGMEAGGRPWVRGQRESSPCRRLRVVGGAALRPQGVAGCYRWLGRGRGEQGAEPR